MVHKLVNVNSENSYTDRECDGTDASFKININNRLLWESAKKTGYEPEKIPRNVKNCVDCGHCCFGCPYEAKQSTITGLMEPMVSKCVEKINNDGSKTIVKGLKIIADCHVGKVTYTHCNGKKFANGVEATVTIYPARGSPREGLNRATPTGKR